MVQIVLDVASEKDADLIKELMKRFKGVEVNSFSTSLKSAQVQQRIAKGLEDADNGNVKPWNEVKKRLASKIKSSKRDTLSKLYLAPWPDTLDDTICAAYCLNINCSGISSSFIARFVPFSGSTSQAICLVTKLLAEFFVYRNPCWWRVWTGRGSFFELFWG